VSALKTELASGAGVPVQVQKVEMLMMRKKEKRLQLEGKALLFHKTALVFAAEVSPWCLIEGSRRLRTGVGPLVDEQSRELRLSSMISIYYRNTLFLREMNSTNAISNARGTVFCNDERSWRVGRSFDLQSHVRNDQSM
jgi:hypothetical protein